MSRDYYLNEATHACNAASSSSSNTYVYLYAQDAHKQLDKAQSCLVIGGGPVGEILDQAEMSCPVRQVKLLFMPVLVLCGLRCGAGSRGRDRHKGQAGDTGD